MAGIGDEIVNPVARMRMRVLQDADSTDGELFEVEATYEPGAQMPLEHFHPAQDEHFEIRAGSMGARIAGRESVFRQGDTIDIPRETVHAMWNAGEEPAVVVWQTRPALRTKEFFEAVASLMSRADAAPEEGAALVRDYADVFRPAGAG